MDVTKAGLCIELPFTASKLVQCPVKSHTNQNLRSIFGEKEENGPSDWILAIAKASEAVRRSCANVSAHQMQQWEFGQSFCDVNSLSADPDANPIPTATLENYLSLFFVESGPQRFGDATFFFPKSLSHRHYCTQALTWKASLMLLMLTWVCGSCEGGKVVFPIKPVF